MTLNILGHVPTNPIDEIFYENRGRNQEVRAAEGTYTLTDVERVKVYRAEFNWDDDWFNLKGFYRTGHFHWGYEGDFFGNLPFLNLQEYFVTKTVPPSSTLVLCSIINSTLLNSKSFFLLK